MTEAAAVVKGPGLRACALWALFVLLCVEIADLRGVVLGLDGLDATQKWRAAAGYALLAGVLVWQWERFRTVLGDLRFWAGLALLLLGAWGLPAWLAAPRQWTTTVRETRIGKAPGLEAPATAADRFGYRRREPAMPRFQFELPEGWQRLPESELRLVNLRPAPDCECYLTGLPSGGVLGNVNRWRQQFGLPDLDAAQVGKLPTKTLLGAPATWVELDGTFGAGGPSRPDWKLFGVIRTLPDGGAVLTVKMTGPKAELEKQRSAFDAWLASVRMDRTAAASEPEGDEIRADRLQWQLPEGWQQAPTRSMLLAVFRAGEAECTLSTVAGGPGSGLLNLNRWRGQLGLVPLDAAGYAALPRGTLLGRQAVVMQERGEFTGMDGVPHKDWAIHALVSELPDSTFCVKLTGPRAAVDAERDRLAAFASSLQWKP